MPIILKSSREQKKPSKALIIFCLVIAGEMIFGLPYHVLRYFRPTMLEVFDLSNTKIGDAFAIYGITAMLSYFPSGVIADHFSARKLMSLSLFTTALGGIYFATIPSQFGLSILFGYWGITNILLFWAAMIRATREWGGKLAQGRAFGLLDGGRGLMSAGAATIAVFLLATILPSNLENISNIQRTQAIKSIIYFYTLLTFGTAVLVWVFIPDIKIDKIKSTLHPFTGITRVLRNRLAWLQAIIVVCAYCGYRGLDFYTLYGIDVLGMNEVSAAQLVSYSTYLRPVAAIGAGFLADRFTTKKVIGGMFTLLLLSYLILVFLPPSSNVLNIITANLLFTFIAVYALRGVYFALFEESNISRNLTGTTVGLISVIGFTPDIFFNSIAGRILDASPGLTGYHHFYLFLCLFATMGMVSTFILARGSKKIITAVQHDSA
jgi:sugar phosphate permease